VLKFGQAALQSRRIERIDGEDSHATLRATQLADQPLAAASRRIGQRGIDNLYEFLITGGKGSRHRRNDTAELSFERCSQRIIGESVGKTDFDRLPGVDFLGSKKHLQCPTLADQPRQALRPTPSSDQSEGGAAMAKQSVRSGDAMLACECEVKAAAHAVSVDYGRGWGRKLRDRPHQTLTHVRKAERLRAGERSDLVQISSGRKEMRVAGKDQARRRVVR
jgi:hypothetical protein